MTKFHPVKVGFVDVIEAFLDGRVRGTPGPSCKLGDIMFDEEDIVALLQSRGEAIPQKEDSTAQPTHLAAA